MWKVIELESRETNQRFSISKDGAKISNQQFLMLLKNDTLFRSFYTEYLISLGYEAFFWENKPMMSANLHQEYECNVLNSAFLAQKSPDFHTFSSYFKRNREVVSFKNSGNDAQLIVPCPNDGHPGYTHIGTFIREAPESQVQKLWERTGREMLDIIGEEPRWLSTSGLGVFWLHIRIDSVPKYYQTEEYKSVG